MTTCRVSWTREQYIIAFRLFIRDTKDQNVLLCNKEENNDDELGLFLDMALDYFNNDIPFTCFGYENFPSKTWLIFRAVIEYLYSIGLLHTRNTFSYNDAGRSIQDFGKQGNHLSFVSTLIQENEMLKRRLKRDINCRAFMGTLGSEYAFVNTHVTRWGS